MRDEEGFTLVEMIIAMTLMAMSLLALAQMLFSSMGALTAAGQRSSSLELVNKEMERIRALPYDEVCVESADIGSAYTGSPPMYDGRPAVVGTTCGFEPEEGPFPASGGMSAYSIRRWVTWTDTAGGGGMDFKRLKVEIEWKEHSRTGRTLQLSSVLYPGGRGEGFTTNSPPAAVASTTPSPATVVEGGSVAFDGSASSDLDGDALTYEWIFGDGGTSTSQSPTHVFNTPGNYDVILKVRDGTDVSQVTVPVSVATSGGNTYPVASFATLSPTSGVAPLTVEFDGSGSSDADGDPLTYTWDWGDGTPPTVGPAAASHVFSSAGIFTVTLQVEDPSGGFDTATTTVSTTPLNCSIDAGHFENPAGNALRNDILVGNSDKPTKNSVTFTAKSNTACSTMKVRLPTSGGCTIDVPLSATTSGGVKTWTATTQISSCKFHLGTNQTGYFEGSDGTVTIDRPVYFTVHR